MATTLAVPDFRLLDVLGSLDPGEAAMVKYIGAISEDGMVEEYHVTLDHTVEQLWPLEDGVTVVSSK